MEGSLTEWVSPEGGTFEARKAAAGQQNSAMTHSLIARFPQVAERVFRGPSVTVAQFTKCSCRASELMIEFNRFPEKY